MKLVIEVDLDHFNGGGVKAIVKQMMSALDQIPDWADPRSLLMLHSDVEHITLGEVVDPEDRNTSQARCIMMRAEYNTTVHIMDNSIKGDRSEQLVHLK